MFTIFDRELFESELNLLDNTITVQMDNEADVRRAFPTRNKAGILGAFSPLNSYFPYIVSFQSDGFTYKYLSTATITYNQAKYLVYQHKSQWSKKYFGCVYDRYNKSVENLVLLTYNPLVTSGGIRQVTDRIMATPTMADLQGSGELVLKVVEVFFKNHPAFVRYEATAPLYRDKVLPALFGLNISKAANQKLEGGIRISLKPFVFKKREALTQVYRGKSHGNNENREVAAARRR